MGVGAERHTKRPRKSKVCQLQVALALDQEILRFQIAVQNPVAMAVTNV
jgi:hypothetical protein